MIVGTTLQDVAATMAPVGRALKPEGSMLFTPANSRTQPMPGFDTGLEAKVPRGFQERTRGAGQRMVPVRYAVGYAPRTALVLLAWYRLGGRRVAAW
jgi:hypothetical protein